MLELGWKKSRSNAQIQLMLLKIYGELGEEIVYSYVHMHVCGFLMSVLFINAYKNRNCINIHWSKS